MSKKNIYNIYGDQPLEMTKKIMEKANVKEYITNKDMLIGIKPNLVVSEPSTKGATTTPEIVEGIIRYLQEAGFYNIIVLEGSWIGDSTTKAFKVCGYERISKKYNVPLVDLQKDEATIINFKGLNIHVCKTALQVEYMINVPVMKGHCQTRMTCALKNIKGCITDKEKRKFHTLGLHKPIGYLNKILKQDLIIVDGMNGDLDFEEGGNPTEMNRITLGFDPVGVDTFIATLMGYDISEVPYIGIAEEEGVGTTDLSKFIISDINQPQNIGKSLPMIRKVKKLAKYIEEDSACSACYGMLVHALDRLDRTGQLNKLTEKIHIGQGYKNKSGSGIGCGSCTKGYMKHITGCPPKANEIIEYLNVIIG